MKSYRNALQFETIQIYYYKSSRKMIFIINTIRYLKYLPVYIEFQEAGFVQISP
jgi:hypothetical protein